MKEQGRECIGDEREGKSREGEGIGKVDRKEQNREKKKGKGRDEYGRKGKRKKGKGGGVMGKCEIAMS